MNTHGTPTPGQPEEGKSLVDALATLFVVCGTDPRFALLREQVSEDLAAATRGATNDHDKTLGLLVEACTIAGRGNCRAFKHLEAELLEAIDQEVRQPKVSKAPRPSKIITFPTSARTRRGRRTPGASTRREAPK